MTQAYLGKGNSPKPITFRFIANLDALPLIGDFSSSLKAIKRKIWFNRDNFNKLNDTELKFSRLKGLIILKISKHNK